MTIIDLKPVYIRMLIRFQEDLVTSQEMVLGILAEKPC